MQYSSGAADLHLRLDLYLPNFILLNPFTTFSTITANLSPLAPSPDFESVGVPWV